MAIINVPGTLHSFETGNVLANANEILDTNLNKKQDVINQDLDEGISSLEALSGYYTCTTSGSTVDKVVSAIGYSLINGGSLKIKFEHAHTLSEGTVTLNINNQGAITILYAGDTVTSSNTWDNDEIVNVFYDGTNYLAYSVEGGGLLNKQTIPPSSQASEKKGLTEKTIALKVEELQNEIDTITASSSTVTITSSRAMLVQPAGTIETISFTGTCNPATSIKTLQQVIDSSWTDIETSSVSDNSHTFNVDLLADNDAAYRFRIRNQIRNTTKYTSDSYIYYVRPIYYGALLTSDLNITDPSEEGYIADFNALIDQLTNFGSATTTARRTYSVGFDNNARRVIIVNPKSIVTNINVNQVYMTSVINTNKMAFTLVNSSSPLARLMDSKYNIYISDNSYNPGGSRNIICQ